VVRWGFVQRTDNANNASPVWIACTLPGGNTPTDLEAHPTDPNIVYATAGNKVYISIDKGLSWNEVPGVLPNIPINTIVYDKNSAGSLYIGTQAGVLYKNQDMTSWVNFSTGLPVTDVRELEILYSADPAANKLMAATFGRGLWRSDLFTVNIAPQANFTASPASPCQYETAQMVDASLNFPTSWQWSFSPSTVTYVNGSDNHSQNPFVQFEQNTSYTVTLVAANAIGSSSISHPLVTGGAEPPYLANFESGAFPGGWTVINPDNALTWEVTTTGGIGTGTKSAFVGFYNYFPSGPMDDLVTEPVKLDGTLHPWLKFKVAYRRYNSDYYDGLKVFISADCGTTWEPNPVYNKSGSSLATGPDQIDMFVPSVSSDWRLDSIDLTPYRQGSVRIKFQSVNGWGNNLYIDNVSVEEQPLLSIPAAVIGSGQSQCFNATQTLKVAGNGNIFLIQAGGSATFIAGMKILFEPGTKVSSGGYLLGYISTDGTYCSQPDMPGYSYGEPVFTAVPGSSFITIYPNPTRGTFTIAATGNDLAQFCRVEIYSPAGQQIIDRKFEGSLKYVIPFEGTQQGLYFVRVTSGEKSTTLKLVKL
jgi:hypothetical protein